MKFVFFDPLLTRVYSALVAIVLAQYVSLSSIGVYAFATLTLTAIQGLFDTSLRNFFLNHSTSNTSIDRIRLTSFTEFFIQNLLVVCLMIFLVKEKQAPNFFWILIFCPTAWAMSRRLHINEMRTEAFRSYSRNRVVLTFIAYFVSLITVLISKSVFALVVLQICLEPLIAVTYRILGRNQTMFRNKSGEQQLTWKKDFRKFQSLTISNWAITLLDRFSLGLFLPPAKFGIWTLLQVIFKAPLEALGISFNSLNRKNFHIIKGNDPRLGLRAIITSFFAAHIIFVLVYFFLFDELSKYFPFIVQQKPLIGLVILSGLAQVVNFISLNYDVFASIYRTSRQWLALVIISSPFVIALGLKSWKLCLIFIILRDLSFMAFSKTIGIGQRVRLTCSLCMLFELVLLVVIRV